MHGPEDIKVSLTGWTDLALKIEVRAVPSAGHCVCNTGVPHLVIPVEDIEAVACASGAARCGTRDQFAPAGTNVNWVAPIRLAASS